MNLDVKLSIFLPLWDRAHAEEPIAAPKTGTKDANDAEGGREERVSTKGKLSEIRHYSRFASAGTPIHVAFIK